MNFIKKKINENKIKKVLGEFNESYQNSNYDECIKKNRYFRGFRIFRYLLFKGYCFLC